MALADSISEDIRKGYLVRAAKRLCRAFEDAGDIERTNEATLLLSTLRRAHRRHNQHGEAIEPELSRITNALLELVAAIG